MSDNRIKFEGLAELREQLRKLPESLAGEAAGIIDSTVTSASAQVSAGYESHNITGELQEGLTTTRIDAGKFAAGAVLKNKSKIASIFENGTQARHTALGYNRGAMPPGRVFVPVVVRARRSMYQKLKDLLVRNGLVVSGDA